MPTSFRLLLECDGLLTRTSGVRFSRGRKSTRPWRQEGSTGGNGLWFAWGPIIQEHPIEAMTVGKCKASQRCPTESVRRTVS